jgi:predicted nucleotidyltransferase
MVDTAQFTSQIVPILKRYSVPKAAYFGSFVDGRYVAGKSDIDILVEPPKGMSLLGFVGLKQDIEDALGVGVDLVSYNGISKYLKESILSHEKVFYETS